MKNKGKQARQPMDERQQKIAGRAALVAYLFLILCLGTAAIYRACTTNDFSWEFFAIAGSILVFVFAKRIMGDIEPPKSLTDKPLPTGDSREEKRIRRRDHLAQALLFALIFTVIETPVVALSRNAEGMPLIERFFPSLPYAAALALNAVYSFLLGFLISFLLIYLGRTYCLKRYRRMCAALEAEAEEEADGD